MTDDPDDYAEQWADLTEKELLVGILTELQAIRVALADDPTPDDAEPRYRCQYCDDVVTADDRERHARESHKAPRAIALSEMFDPLEGQH